jgi:HTH-type transcriptional regulator / antitoxin HigA
MNVISRPAIRAAQAHHPKCRKWLDDWWKTARRARWTKLHEVRTAYPSADQVGGCLVFDAPGARRLIVGVYYSRPGMEGTGTLYVKHFLTSGLRSWQLEKGLLIMASTTYAILLQEAQPRVIHDDKTHQHALKWIDRLMKLPRLSSAQQTLLELLSKLANDYEEELYPTPDVPPRDILQHLLESSGKSQAEFARTIGIPRSMISEVLKGKRSISVENAFRLADHFHVEPSLFIARR